MGNNLLKEKLDYLFLKVYGITLNEMNKENKEHTKIIVRIDCLENFYDNSYTYFLLPCPNEFWKYRLYRVLGSGKYGYKVEELEYMDFRECYNLIDKDGKCHWKRYKDNHLMFKVKAKQLKQRYGFDGLYHYTDFSNLKSIFNSGYLKSRNECEYNYISFVDGASKSVLYNTSVHVKECVRFYYRPKPPTLYNNECIKLKEYKDSSPHLPIPVCLVFDEELIYLDTTMFTDRNSGCSGVKLGDDYTFFNNIEWHKVFSNSYYYAKEWRNKMQAELLSKIPVSLDYLKKIIFRCEADMKRAINLFGKDERYIVDLNVFSDKNIYFPTRMYYYNNFIKNYHIVNLKKEIGLDMLFLELEFQRSWEDYEIKIFIRDNDYNIKEVRIIDSEVFRKTNDPYSFNYIIHNFNEDFYKLEVYLNGILSVEEYLEKYR